MMVTKQKIKIHLIVYITSMVVAIMIGLNLGKLINDKLNMMKVVAEPMYIIEEELPNEDDELTDWEIMQLGLIKVESEGNTRAVSTANARGIFQITPIYVREANRLCKLKGINKRFTHDDAFDVEKSFEMFEIVSNHKYKQKNIENRIRATIKGHNPTAGDWYSKRVYKAIEELKENEDLLSEYARFLPDNRL